MAIRKISLINIGLLLSLALIGSLIMARPVVLSHTAVVPIFVDETVNVAKPAAVSHSISIPKAIAIAPPAPLSRANVAPLPILPPRITHQVLPQYPLSALQQGFAGVTMLSVLIGTDGNVENVEVKTSSGITEMDESAMKAIVQWKFAAASQGGAALASWLDVPVRFAIINN